MLENVLLLILLGIISFIQNMAFTAVSRSRTSADPEYHRVCSWFSNGIWFICNIMITKTVWNAINSGSWGFVILAGIIYVLCTAEGSVLMMRKLLKSEKGKRRVGARGN